MPTLFGPTVAANPWLWAGLGLCVAAALVWDLGLLGRLLGRPPTPPSAQAAWARTVLYSALAVAFAGALATRGGAHGMRQAEAFLSVYVVEFALSVDNLFVFLLIFRAFAVAPAQAQRVLLWGIVGALALRGALIAAGGALLSRYAWLFYPVGALLVGTGAKLLFGREAEPTDARQLAPVRLLRRLLPVAGPAQLEGRDPDAFVVRSHGRLWATQLGLVLLAIEASDVVFALDSVPASFAMTDDVALIYAANVCAILGLRALYAALSAALGGLRFLKPGLALILIGIGGKMIGHTWFAVSNGLSLAAIAAILAAAAIASWRWPHAATGS